MSDELIQLCERLNEALIEAGRTAKETKQHSSQTYWNGVCRGYVEAILIVQDFAEDIQQPTSEANRE